MEPKCTKQEILLFTSTTFSKKNFTETNDPNIKRSLEDIDQLEEACWNGLLPEIMPEINEEIGANNKLFVWSIDKAKFFLCIERAEQPMAAELLWSVNPYLFLLATNYN
jgi:hypothetical protein